MLERIARLEKTRARALFATVILTATCVFIAFHTSAPEVEILGRYSRRFFATLLVYVIFTLVVAALAIAPPFPLQRVLNGLRRAPILILTVCIALSMVLWVVIPGQAVAKLYPSAALLLLLWLLLDDVSSELQQWGSRWMTRWLLALLAVGLVLELVVLLRLPALSAYDEGAYASVAMRFLQTGMLPGDFLGFPPRHFIGFGSWLVTLGYWFDALGFGWWTGRLYAFIASGLSLVILYQAGKTLYQRQSGIAAAVFMALSGSFVSSHGVRPDAPMLLMVAGGLAAYVLAWRQARPRYYFLHGFLVALSLEAHLLGLAFWGAYGGVYGLRWLYRCWSARQLKMPTELLWYIAGGLIPVALFFVTHVLPDWGLPNAIILSDRSFTVARGFRQEVRRWVDYVTTYPLEAMIVVWAVVYALRRRRPEDRQALGFLALLLLAYVFIAPTDWPQYTRYFIPVSALLVGGMLSSDLSLKPALAIATIGLVFGALVGDVRKVLPDALHDGLTTLPTPPVVEYVAENLAPGSTVVMDMAYYLYFEDGHRYHYVQPGIHPPTINRLGGPPEDQVWYALNPDIVVLDVARNEHSQWLDDYLESAQFVYVELFEDAGIAIYLPADSPLSSQR